MSVVLGQHSPNRVFVQLDTEALGQLLCDLRAALVRVAPFEFEDRLDQILSGPFRAGFVAVAGAIEPFEFELYECPMTAQQGRGFYEDGRAKEPTRRQEERAQTEEEAIGEAKVRSASA